MPHPDPEDRRPANPELPCDDLVLAATERAARHRARDTEAVPTWAIFEHLAIGRRSAPARHVRVRLDVLHAAGWVETRSIHGVACWELTVAGRGHLRRARRRREIPALPESPQHREWRNARTCAAQEIARFRSAFGERLRRGDLLLDDDRPAPSSDELFELAEDLRRACRLVASATYCLYEWAEPDDAHADVESHLDLAGSGLSAHEQALRRSWRAGRRNVKLWDLDPGAPPADAGVN